MEKSRKYERQNKKKESLYPFLRNANRMRPIVLSSNGN
jgi:hypothetical protein